MKTAQLIVLASILMVLAQAQDRREWHFDLGSGPVAKGFIQINENSVYTGEKEFGLISEKQVVAENRPGKDDLINDFITGDVPFFFSVGLPEGRYRVTMTFGDPGGGIGYDGKGGIAPFNA